MNYSGLKERPWFLCWIITSMFIMLFPHSTDIDNGVHFHDEEIIEDWIEVHEKGYIVVPAHSTAGPTVDSIPLIVQSNWNGIKFSFDQRTAYNFNSNLINVTVCVSDFNDNPINNGSMYLAPLEQPDVSLDAWLDENGCVIFVAREIQNQLLIFDLNCTSQISSEVCEGNLIIPANTGKLWDMNIHSTVTEKVNDGVVNFIVIDDDTKKAINSAEIWSDNQLIGVTNNEGSITISKSEIVEHEVRINNIQDEHVNLRVSIDDIPLKIKVENNVAYLPKLLQQNIEIKTSDQYFWPWEGVALSVLLDNGVGGGVGQLGGSDENGILNWEGLLPEGVHQIIGITSNESVNIPAASAYSTITGSPTYLSRFSVGNSIMLTVLSKLGILSLAGSISLLILAIGSWNILRRVTESNEIHWVSAGLLNLNGSILIITHADLMSDLHAMSFMVLGISLFIQFISECREIKSIDQWWTILASGLFIGLSISMRFVHLFYMPIIFLASILIKPNNSEMASNNIRSRFVAFAVLITCIGLALTPTLVYQEDQHGNAFKYSASKGENPPIVSYYDYQWTSSSSFIIVENTTSNNNQTSQADNNQTTDTNQTENISFNVPEEDSTNAVEEFSSEFTDSFGKITIQERSYFAQISTVILFILAYCPIVILALIAAPITWNSDYKSSNVTTNGIKNNGLKLLMILWLLWGIFSLIIDRSPFYVSHWNDDIRYFIPLVTPAVILLGIVIVEQKERFVNDYKNAILLIATMVVCSLLVTIPRLLWEGTRRPMSKSMGLAKEGRFDLTNMYEYTNTPNWILDAQYAWHPFTERLAFATYEIFAIIISISMISFITWSYFKYEKLDVADSEE